MTLRVVLWCGVLTLGCAASSERPHAAAAAIEERSVPQNSSSNERLAKNQRRSADPAGLAHVLRGLHFLTSGRAAAAVPHLRLALLHDRYSAFIHLKLATAWRESGQGDRARQALRSGLELAPYSPALNALAGRWALEAADYSTAVEHFERALDDPSAAIRAAPFYIDALAWSGRGGRASVRALELVERDPADEGTALTVGFALEDHGELDTALQLYERAARQRPSSRSAAFGRMRIYELKGDYERAGASLTALFAHYPTDSLLFLLAYRLYQRADHEDAKVYLKEALRLSHGDDKTLSWIADGVALEGDVDEALAILNEEVGRGADQYARATILERVGRFADCLGVLAELSDDDSPGMRLRARCAAGAGAMKRAAADLSTLAERLPAGDGKNDERLMRDVAQVFAWLPSAKAALRRVEAFGKTHRAIIGGKALDFARAEVLDHFGRIREARDILLPYYEADPSDPYLVLRVSDLVARTGDISRATDNLEAFLAAEPTSAFRLNALGFTLADLGERRDWERGEVYLRRAYRLTFDDGFIVDSLGWLRLRQGAVDEALRLLERAVRLEGMDPEVLCHYAFALQAAGREREARGYFERAEKANPGAGLAGQIAHQLRGRRGDP